MADHDDEGCLGRFFGCYLKICQTKFLSYVVIAINLAAVFGTMTLQGTVGKADLNVVTLWLVLGDTRGHTGVTVRNCRFPEALVVWSGTNEIHFTADGKSSDGSLYCEWNPLANYIYVRPNNQTFEPNSKFLVTSWGWYTMPSVSVKDDPVTWKMIGFTEKTESQDLSVQDKPYDVPETREELVGRWSVHDNTAGNCMDKAHIPLGLAAAFAVIGFTIKVWKCAINCFGVGLPLYFVAEFSPILIAIMLSVNLSVATGCGYQGLGFVGLLLPCLVVWFCCLFRPCLMEGYVEKTGERVTEYVNTGTGAKVGESRENVYRVI